jgi:HK97 family phage major capsid protein
MGRIKVIEARKLEIRSLLEDEVKKVTIAEMDAFETELRELNEEKKLIEKRQSMIDGIEKRAEETETKKEEFTGKKVEKESEKRSVGETGTIYDKKKKLVLFNNLGEQLRSIQMAAKGQFDERLQRIDNECRATGMNAGVGSEGGFAIQTDFGGMMMDTAAKSGEILSRVDTIPVTDGADSYKWVDIDETSVATTVYGGVQVYRRSEAQTVSATKPKLLEKELKLETLMGLAYATWELEKHTSFTSELYTKAFTKAIQRKLEGEIVAGLGAGECLGFLKGGDYVAIDKEQGQAAATLQYENIVKMYNRAIDKQNSIWLANPDAHEQLDFLSFPVGVGGVPVYLPASSIGTLDSLKGRPLVESDHCPALGTAGDLAFVNLDEYIMIMKGGVEQEYSIHVNFTTAENAFRFMFEANGMPKKSSTLTIKNSSKPRSNFNTVATRA